MNLLFSWQALDTDKSGYLDREEFLNFASNMPSKNREKLLRHFGFYHKVFDKITADQMKIEPTDAIDVKSELESSTGGDTPKTSDAQSDAGNATPLHLPEIKDEIMTEVIEKKPEDAGSNPAAMNRCVRYIAFCGSNHKFL